MQEGDPAHKQSSDLELVQRAKKDRREFGALYDKYWNQIYVFVYQRVSSTDDSQDVCQQVFVKAMLNLHKYEDRGFAFSSWLYRIAISETSNFLSKSNKRRNVYTQASQLGDLQQDLEESQFEQEAMIKALDTLPDQDLLMVEMKYFEGFKFREISEVIGITESNCKVRMHRVLKRLAKSIKEQLHEA